MRKILAAMVAAPRRRRSSAVAPVAPDPARSDRPARRWSWSPAATRSAVHHPDQACATGLAAGNSDTAIREYLLGKGYTAYTSPAMNGRGQVVDQQGFGPSACAR